MNTLIPLESYSNLYYHFLLVVTFIVFMQSRQLILQDSNNLKSKNFLGIGILLFVILYIGLRPVSFIFGDMGVYAIDFQKYADGAPINQDKDIFFEMFMQKCSKIMTAEAFFFLCSMIYVLPLYFAVKRFFKDYWFYGFLILVVSFSFWAYGTNGIRNGIGTSLFIFALSCKKKYVAYGIIFLSILIHKSLMLPTAAYAVTFFYRNTKHYLLFWVLTIPLSLALGGFWENFFMGLGFGEEERLTGYLVENQDTLDQIVEVKIGFRWDFILYSFIGVYAGWFFILKKGFKDIVYNQLFSMYLVANGIWILVIRANFSNRFAYLSWFMLGLIVVYPFLKKQFFKEQHQILAGIILLYFSFTYVLNVILVKQ